MRKNKYKFDYITPISTCDTKAWLHKGKFIKLQTFHADYIIKKHWKKILKDFGSHICSFIKLNDKGNTTFIHAYENVFRGWALKNKYVRVSLKSHELTFEYIGELSVKDKLAVHEIVKNVKEQGYVKYVVFSRFKSYDFHSNRFFGLETNVVGI